MDSEKHPLHIAVAFDQNYRQPFYALVASIFDSNTLVPFSFHCITRSISEKEKQQIVEYVENNNSTIKYYEVDEGMVSRFVTLNHWNTSVYYKIFFPLIVGEEVKRLLYLDSDTLVLNSLQELFTMDLQTNPLAVAKDIHVRNEIYSELHKREDYFNSGVMLIDVLRWNSLEISQKTFKFLNDHPEKITYVDQDALNVVLENKYLLISDRFNYTYSHIPSESSSSALKKILRDLVVIHFTISRPWNFLCKNRFRGLYKYYLAKSPLKMTGAVVDFSISKIPAYVRIRLVELYFDSPYLMKTWKFLKSVS